MICKAKSNSDWKYLPMTLTLININGVFFKGFPEGALIPAETVVRRIERKIERLKNGGTIVGGVMQWPWSYQARVSK